ncbi:Hly-III-related protein [Metarhizium guizhouense ARSEF 977]|uniref:Hly-III-related protein n=1 Tax=Metarhizium guizhouense (strain ARSEF 977) TaxID=1276136 RepID=A0A0B4GF93_METGA|nr:Hly-III-related protein [Metarhizium guizhouense ARSEF 977]
MPTKSTVNNTITAIGTKTEASLLIWDDLPDWRRDNGFIYSGYRQILPSYLHSLGSLFYLHNQTVNIWSHLVGTIVTLGASLYLHYVIYPRYESATLSDALVFACFSTGTVLCLGMSATFHALQDHSQEVARWGNKLDYTGIVALIVGSHVPALYYGFSCKPGLFSTYLCLICLLGAGCTTIAWIEQFRTPQWRLCRAMMFVGLGLSSMIPVIHGITIYGYKGLENRMSVTWTIVQGALYIFGAVLYATRWPERVFPGDFDVWGNSHQIFHICVLLAVATHFYGMANAFDYHHTVLGTHCFNE